MLVDMEHVGGHHPERRPGGGEVAERHDHLPAAELTRELDRVGPARAAECVDDEIPRVAAALDRHLAHQIRHLRLDDAHRAVGRLDRVHAELGGDRLDRLAGGVDVELQLAAEEGVRVVTAEQEVAVGDGRADAAAPVAGGSRLGRGALRADPHRAALLVEPDDRAAAGADRLDVESRHEERVLVDHGLRGAQRFAIGDDADVERGPAHVAGDHVRVVHLPGQVGGAGDPADRPRADREERLSGRLPRRHDPTGRLHDQQGMLKSVFAGRLVHLVDVVGGAGPDEGVDRGRRRALVLTGLGDQLVGAADKDVWRDLFDQLTDPQLVRRVDEAPEEGDRDRLDPIGDELLDRRPRLILIQVEEYLSRPVEPLRDLHDPVRRDDRVGLAVAGDVQQPVDRQPGRAAVGAHDDQRVAVAGGGDQAGLGAPHLDQDVGADGGPVEQQVGLGKKVVQ